ncbi:MAG: PQQ-binding-like beta-propeller repeat protein [Sedimentisphaerales bacterium]|nr:PQQ-binding-like beta-propeller repeat protein [Sedimentisphaerales bacterium]
MKPFLPGIMVASPKGHFLAVCESNRLVSIWDVHTGEMLSRFMTVYELGGTRLLIDNEGQICVAGAWGSHGIKAYRTKDGSELWHRKDLKRLQRMTLSAKGDVVFCGFESGPGHALDLRTGQTIEKISGAAYIIDSPFEDRRYIAKAHCELQTKDGERINLIKPVGAPLVKEFWPFHTGTVVLCFFLRQKPEVCYGAMIRVLFRKYPIEKMIRS